MEKPVAERADRIADFQKALTAGQGRLLMGFQYRFHPGLLKLKALIADGSIGRPLSFRACWGEYLPNWHPWEDYRKSYSARPELGGGVALTLSHPLDYLRWLFGEVSAVWGFSGKISNLELAVDDVAEIGLKLANGMIGSVHLDYYRRFVRNDLEVVGTQGIVSWRNADALVTLQNETFPDGVDYPPAEGFDRNWLFLDEMRHFIDVVQRKADPSCTLEDGLKAQLLVEAFKRSWDEKQVIELDGEPTID
jgi:predicted dehydrogenase